MNKIAIVRREQCGHEDGAEMNIAGFFGNDCDTRAYPMRRLRVDAFVRLQKASARQ